MHLLDDGFQHRALARDFDLVVLTATETRDQLLPFGRLREPLTSLERADTIVFSLSKQDDWSGDWTPRGPLASSIPQQCWRLERRTIFSRPLPEKPIAFCGIARPALFFADLRSGGISPADELAFPDHHSYSQGDIESLLRLRDTEAATGFVTTEKDAINLGSRAAALQPLAIAKVELELEDADRVISNMLQTVADRYRARS